MSKLNHQKGRLLEVQRILNEDTDENHRISVPDLLERLKTGGIPVERKSLYSDIETLNYYGADIKLQRGKGSGYFVASRLFDQAELKLLVDAVQCAKFIPRKRTDELTEKLEKLTSKYLARQLQRQVGNAGRVKSDNKQILYIVDTIHQAIDEDKSITFRYKQWVVDRSKPGGFTSTEKHAGKIYRVSPWVLAWQEENYYLIGYDEDTSSVRHYRVDKISEQKIADYARTGREYFEHFDLSGYVRGRFGMFAGKETEIRLQVKNELVGVLVDRFGSDIVLTPGEKEGWFAVNVSAVPADPFYGWVMSFGDQLRVTAPETVANEVARRAEAIGKMYQK